MTNSSHYSYKFCPVCASTLEQKLVDDKPRLACLKCGFVFWNNPKPSVSIILAKDDNVLLLQRAHEPAKGFWVLPGGYVEYDEDPQKTIAREAKEETGMDVSIDKLLWTYLIDTDPRGNGIDIVFVGTITGGNIRLVEHSAHKFFAPDALPENIAYRHRDAIKIWSETS